MTVDLCLRNTGRVILEQEKVGISGDFSGLNQEYILISNVTVKLHEAFQLK